MMILHSFIIYFYFYLKVTKEGIRRVPIFPVGNGLFLLSE